MKFLRALTLLLCISPFSSPHAQDYGDKDAPECRHVECVVVESRGRGILIPSDDRLRREFEARLEAERRNPYGPRPAPPSANYYGTAPPPDPYAQPYSPPTQPAYGPPNPKVHPVHPKATSASEAITQYGHDALGRNTLIDDSEYGATVIDYWPDGRIRSIERSGGVVSEYTYDLAGRAETITHTRGAEVIARVAYDYDANGNRIEERLSQGGAERITTYEYDRDDRLIAVNTPDGRDEYTLDPVGNRIGEKSWAGDELINDITQAFDARDRILSRTDAISGLSTSYQHDANGNLTAETVSGPGISETTTTYVYDPENRLLEVRKPSGNVQYTFDAEGKRIASSASGRARYDAGSLYAELNGANQVIRRHHTSAPNRAASRGWMQRAAATLTLFLGFSDPGGATTQHFHHLHDALNTPIATTSADGNIAQRNIYDAFGNLDEQTSPNPYLAERPSRIGFTGYQLDRETSSDPEADGGISQTSYHAKARQYHAGRGSFMQQDPWAGEHTNPASLHRYLYAYANPGMFVDPDGRIGVFNDGTWNDQYNEAQKKNGELTNVAKLHELYDGHRVYQDGIGTDWYTKTICGLTGCGFHSRVSYARDRIIEVYNDPNATEEDRQIDIFGFSRGAAESRALVHWLQDEGIPVTTYTTDYVPAGTPTGGNWVRTPTTTIVKPQIRYVGLFDTVPALGWPLGPNSVYHQLYLGYRQDFDISSVGQVRHAVAANEHRYAFDLQSIRGCKDCDLPANAQEVWFLGPHAGVGGGYGIGEGGQRTAEYPLAWQYREAVAAGVPLLPYPKHEHLLRDYATTFLTLQSSIQDSRFWTDLMNFKTSRTVYYDTGDHEYAEHGYLEMFNSAYESARAISGQIAVREQ